MSIQEKYKNYKLDKEVEGSKEFFRSSIPESWTFQNYLDKTFNELSKNNMRNIKHIYSCYRNDLQWLLKLNEVPDDIKNYISGTLAPQGRFTKKELKSLIQSKGRAAVHKPIITNNYAENIFNSGSTQNNFFGDSFSSKRKYDQLSDDSESISSSSDEDNDEESNVWKNWLKFLKAEENNTNFHPFSPEKHKIIRCGQGISPRPYLDPKLYKKHLKRHIEQRFPLPVECTTYIDAVLDSKTIQTFEKNIKAVPEYEDNDIQNAVDFLSDIFLSMLRFYKTKQALTSSESVFNHLLIYRFMDSVALSIQNKHDCGSDFIPGEAYLSAIKKQLKNIGNYKDRFQYKADGTFGSLAMLKAIADEFNYAQIDVSVNVKVFFVHAAETSIHLWSLSFKKEGIYELWREDVLDIKPLFADHQDMLQDTIRFYWTMKKLIEEAVDNIVLLRYSHDMKKREFRYSELSPPILTDVVNPTILALNQKYHSKGMAEEGPFHD